MEARLSAAEKKDRRRMAAVAVVYTIGPYERTGEDLMAEAGQQRVPVFDSHDLFFVIHVFFFFDKIGIVSEVDLFFDLGPLIVGHVNTASQFDKFAVKGL